MATESVVVYSSNAQPLYEKNFTASDFFGLWHVVAPAPVAGMRLEGSTQRDVLRGDAGDDTLIGSGGADRLEGGGGFDTVDYSVATGSMVIDLMSPSQNSNIAAGRCADLDRGDDWWQPAMIASAAMVATISFRRRQRAMMCCLALAGMTGFMVGLGTTS